MRMRRRTWITGVYYPSHERDGETYYPRRDPAERRRLAKRYQALLDRRQENDNDG